MGNKKATGFLCLRLVPCFAYVGAEDNRKGIPFVKIVSLLCKLIQFLMVALSVTVHKALILLVFLNHPYQSLALKENLQSVIKAKNWEAEVIVDVNHGDLQSLKREGVNLFLIPEDIARYIDYSSVRKDECFKLTHDEYESGNIDRVVKYIEEN